MGIRGSSCCEHGQVHRLLYAATNKTIPPSGGHDLPRWHVKDASFWNAWGENLLFKAPAGTHTLGCKQHWRLRQEPAGMSGTVYQPHYILLKGWNTIERHNLLCSFIRTVGWTLRQRAVCVQTQGVGRGSECCCSSTARAWLVSTRSQFRFPGSAHTEKCYQ